MSEPQSAESAAGRREAIRKRIVEWLRSTSEFYAGPVGSEAWIDGLTNYLLNNPWEQIRVSPPPVVRTCGCGPDDPPCQAGPGGSKGGHLYGDGMPHTSLATPALTKGADR